MGCNFDKSTREKKKSIVLDNNGISGYKKMESFLDSIVMKKDSYRLSTSLHSWLINHSTFQHCVNDDCLKENARHELENRMKRFWINFLENNDILKKVF